MSIEKITAASDLSDFNRACLVLDHCTKDLDRCTRQYDAAFEDAAASNHMDAKLDDDGTLGSYVLAGNGESFPEVAESNRKVRALHIAAECLTTSRLRFAVAQREFRAAK